MNINSITDAASAYQSFEKVQDSNDAKVQRAVAYKIHEIANQSSMTDAIALRSKADKLLKLSHRHFANEIIALANQPFSRVKTIVLVKQLEQLQSHEFKKVMQFALRDPKVSKAFSKQLAVENYRHQKAENTFKSMFLNTLSPFKREEVKRLIEDTDGLEHLTGINEEDLPPAAVESKNVGYVPRKKNFIERIIDYVVYEYLNPSNKEIDSYQYEKSGHFYNQNEYEGVYHDHLRVLADRMHPEKKLEYLEKHPEVLSDKFIRSFNQYTLENGKSNWLLNEYVSLRKYDKARFDNVKKDADLHELTVKIGKVLENKFERTADLAKELNHLSNDRFEKVFQLVLDKHDNLDLRLAILNDMKEFRSAVRAGKLEERFEGGSFTDLYRNLAPDKREILQMLVQIEHDEWEFE